MILDIPGAERLLGRGDMLFMAPDASKLERIQGTMVTDDEIALLVRYWRGFRTLDGGRTAIGATTLDLPAASLVIGEDADPKTPKPHKSPFKIYVCR